MANSLRTILLLCAVAVSALLPGVGVAADRDEPFGIATVAAPDGPLWNRWRQMQSDLRADAAIVAQCRADPKLCESPTALGFIAIVDEARQYDGLARIGHINRAVNLAIRPYSDIEEGYDDGWNSPLNALASGAGNCTTYAIIKYAMLRDAGIAAGDLRLVIVHIGAERNSLIHHMVAAVRAAGRWLVLDNRSMGLVDSNERHDYRPMFVLDEGGVRQSVQRSSPAAAGGPCYRVGKLAGLEE